MPLNFMITLPRNNPVDEDGLMRTSGAVAGAAARKGARGGGAGDGQTKNTHSVYIEPVIDVKDFVVD